MGLKLTLNETPKTFVRLTCNVGGTKAALRTETLDGEEYLVAPTVMLTEGVHQGNNGRLLYTKEVYTQNTVGWDHKPAVLYHPDEGSAALPKNLEARRIGLILNTSADDKLRTETWINKTKANRLDKRLLQRVENGEVIEVSTGLYVQTDNTPGTWNGEQYDAKVTGFVPDHLAILPDKIGACSVAKGAGLLQLNQEPEAVAETYARSLRHYFVLSGLASPTNNELSFSGIADQLRSQLATRFGKPGEYWSGWIVEIFPDRVVFQTEDRYNGDFYVLGYTVGANDSVSLATTDPAKVERQVNYRPVKNEATMTREQRIAMLVQNGYAGKEDWLNKLSDTDLANVVPLPQQPTNNGQQNNPPTPTPAPVAPPATVEAFVATAPPALRNVLNSAVREYDRKRATLVANITANPKNTFPKEFLDQQPVEFLESLDALAAQPAAAGATPTNNAQSDDPFKTVYYGYQSIPQPAQQPTNNAQLPVLTVPVLDAAPAAAK